MTEDGREQFNLGSSVRRKTKTFERYPISGASTSAGSNKGAVTSAPQRDDTRPPSSTDVDENEPHGGGTELERDADTDTSSIVTDTSQSLQSFTIAGNLRDNAGIWKGTEKLIDESRFEDAILFIQDFQPTQRQQLLLSECYLQLGKMRNAIKSIETLETLLMDNSSIDDIAELVDECISVESYVRALILLPCLSKMYKLYSDPNEAVKKIAHCSYKCAREVIDEMLQYEGRPRVIATDLGLEMLENMLAQLRSVSGADSDLKVENECRCLFRIADYYDNLENYHKSIELCQQCVDQMRNHFGANASKYRLFGSLLDNIGDSHLFLNNYAAASEFYSRALEVYDVVEDWLDDNSKLKTINIAKDNLDYAEDMISPKNKNKSRLCSIL